MTTMPPKAMPIAIPVRSGIASRSTNFPASAARNGATLISTNVLATVVRVSDAMKKKKVQARQTPAIRPGLPIARTAAGMRAPCMTRSTPATNAAMNRLRQNTISQASVNPSWRTRKPPDDQQIAATTMKAIARRRAAGVSCMEREWKTPAFHGPASMAES